MATLPFAGAAWRLLHADVNLMESLGLDGDEATGAAIVKSALEAPLKSGMPVGHRLLCRDERHGLPNQRRVLGCAAGPAPENICNGDRETIDTAHA